MGLSGRKVKQRIGHDPRNLSWADDANKFGASYLQKLGWSAGTGLGASAEGRTSHIKVHQKLDMLGIGAAHQKDPNGIAWKQNKDFENLLKRLNGETVTSTPVDGFVQAGQETKDEESESVQEEEAASSGADAAPKGKKDKKDKKRKKSRDEDDGEEPKKKKRKSKSKDKATSDESNGSTKKDKKDRKKEDESVDATTEQTSASLSSAATSQAAFQVVASRPHRAHRSRFLAAKRMALSSSSAVDEILGISRSTSGTPRQDSSTSIPGTPDTQDDMKLQELKTSSKSVMDYFKEKLLAKSNRIVTSDSAYAPFTLVPEFSQQPSRDQNYDDYDDRPRGGLGLGASRGLGSSLRVETVFEEETETARTGLGAVSSTSAMFGTASSFVSASGDVKASEEVVVSEKIIEVSSKADNAVGTRKQKKEKKEKKRKEEERVEANDDEMKARIKKKGKDRLKDTNDAVVDTSAKIPAEGTKKLRKRKAAEGSDAGKEEKIERRKKSKKDKRATF